MITSEQIGYVIVGGLGIYLAHFIENRYQNPNEAVTFNLDHINRVALYWGLGATAYFLLGDWFAESRS
tara:strand:+ start:440 stop:643 length:204 start_codon:yes stop_codon:yes gene_type:complete